MCKIEGINWCVVKSNSPISKNLNAKLNRIRKGFVRENSFSFYYTDNLDKEKVLKVLKNYKRLSFEIVSFYDKQFGLTINVYGYNPELVISKSNSLPLKFRFNWHNHGDTVQTVTPITTKQHKNIIKINC